MNDKDRIIIKEGLSQFYGSIGIIEERSKTLKEGGYAIASIRDVINGRRKNEKLLTLCAEVLLELKQQKSQVNNRLSNIITQIQSLQKSIS